MWQFDDNRYSDAVKLLVSTPFPVGAFVWETRPGSWRLNVHARATYQLVHGGESSLCVHQPPIAPEDRAPLKEMPEVMVVGHAHAAPGKPVEGVLARLRIGDLERATQVDNADGAILQLGPCAPSWSTPGPDDAASNWARRFASDLKRIQGPPPAFFEFETFNLAPLEQRLSALQLQSAIVLEHLHPTDLLLATRLRPIRPRAMRAPKGGGPAVEVELVADTLWIDADRGTASVVWRGGLDLDAAPDAVGELTVTMESGHGSETEARRPSMSGTSSVHPLNRRHDAVKEHATRSVALPPLRPSGTVELSIDDGGPDAGVQRSGSTNGPVIGDVDDDTTSETDDPETLEPPTLGDEPTTEPQHIDLLRCAEIQARLCGHPNGRQAILREERLSESEWGALRTQWAARITEECFQGVSKLRDRYDGALLAALERHRGPFSHHVAARIIVATERGDLQSLTTELTLSEDELLALSRGLNIRDSADDVRRRATAAEIAKLRDRPGLPPPSVAESQPGSA